MPPTFILSQNQTLQFFLLKPPRARFSASRTDRRDALDGIVSQKRNGLMVCGNRSSAQLERHGWRCLKADLRLPCHNRLCWLAQKKSTIELSKIDLRRRRERDRPIPLGLESPIQSKATHGMGIKNPK